VKRSVPSTRERTRTWVREIVLRETFDRRLVRAHDQAVGVALMALGDRGTHPQRLDGVNLPHHVPHCKMAVNEPVANPSPAAIQRTVRQRCLDLLCRHCALPLEQDDVVHRHGGLLVRVASANLPAPSVDQHTWSTSSWRGLPPRRVGADPRWTEASCSMALMLPVCCATSGASR
jgi:hypothetical protein